MIHIIRERQRCKPMLRCALSTLFLSLSLFTNSTAAKITPQVEKFPFGFYSVGYGTGNPRLCGEILKSLKDNGITLLGPYYGKDFDALKQTCYQAAAQLHLDSIYYIPIIDKQSQKVASFLTPESAFRLRQQDDIADQVQEQIELVSSDPALRQTVKWWGIMPEELRSWRKEEMDYLSNLVQSIRAAEKKLGLQPRPIMMYEPSNRRKKLLEVTGRYLDIQAIGTYTRDTSDSAQIKAIRDSAITLTQTAQEIGTYPIVTLPLSKPYPSSMSPEEITQIIRRNTYIALIDGAKGILVWSWATRKGLSSADRNIQAAAYASVAKDLNGPLNLGEVFLRGKTINIESSRSNAVLIRALEYKNDLFIILANTGSSEEQLTLSVPVGLKPTSVISQAATLTNQGGTSVSLKKYGVLALKFNK